MIEKHAKATILAYKKINNSVLLVNDNAFDESCKKTLDKTPCYYMGIKNTPLLKATAEVLKAKNYILHTLDKKALGGRAIDIDLINPLTGRIMTGSSSGTAINVFLGINDIGIGSDGGGSVLAPALSLNLYGFISPI
nr:hypothetical protein [Mycoplasmatales bacterium]